MSRSIDYRTAAWQLNISPVALLKKLRNAGAIHSHGPERNQPKPGYGHLFDTELTQYKCGTRWKPHHTLLVRPAGRDYLTALLAGDTKRMKALTIFTIDREFAHQKIAEISAMVSH